MRMRLECARRNSPIFWNGPPKNIPDQQKCVAFQKSLHPTVQYYTGEMASPRYYTLHGEIDSSGYQPPGKSCFVEFLLVPGDSDIQTKKSIKSTNS